MSELKKELWFRRKTYGWGWTPIVWKGWAVVAGWLVVNMLSIALLFSRQPKSYSLPSVRIVIFLMIVIATSFIVLGISYAKGELPRWQWGNPKSKDWNKE